MRKKLIIRRNPIWRDAVPQEPQPGRFWTRNEDVTKVAKLDQPPRRNDLAGGVSGGTAMTAQIHAFPSPVSRALDNARQIVRDPSLHPDAIVLEACSFMAGFGDWMDGNEARMMRRAIEAEAEVQRLYGQPAPRSAVTLDGLIIWGFAAFFSFSGGVWLAKQAVAYAPDWVLNMMGFL